MNRVLPRQRSTRQTTQKYIYPHLANSASGGLKYFSQQPLSTVRLCLFQGADAPCMSCLLSSFENVPPHLRNSQGRANPLAFGGP